MNSLYVLDLPLNWSTDVKKFRAGLATSDRLEITLTILKKIGGLLLTIVPISFGAPFRSDLLTTLTGIKDRTSKKTITQ
jgi:hypothetical protein